MTKVRFTAEQIADFLQQSKNGVPDKVLREKYESSISTLHRWQEQHAEGIRRELKQLEPAGAIVFLSFFVSATLFAITFSESLSARVILFFLAYCVDYIHQFRKVFTRHI